MKRKLAYMMLFSSILLSIGHALQEQEPKQLFDQPQHGKGVWAPAIYPDIYLQMIDADWFRVTK